MVLILKLEMLLARKRLKRYDYVCLTFLTKILNYLREVSPPERFPDLCALLPETRYTTLVTAVTPFKYGMVRGLGRFVHAGYRFGFGTRCARSSGGVAFQ